MLIYRIRRQMLTCWSMIANRVRMVLHGVTYGKGFYCCGSIFFRKALDGSMVLGNNVSINSHKFADPIGGDEKTMLIVGKHAKLILHDGVSISNATIFASTYIEIGEQTCIGGGVKIYDTDFHSTQVNERLNCNMDVPCKSVYIGKRVFIGGHSIILKGVSIGDEAVIGAGSIVTKDVPSGEIWAGNPAKFIKKV